MDIRNVTVKEINQEIDNWRARLTLTEVFPPIPGPSPRQKLVFVDAEVRI